MATYGDSFWALPVMQAAAVVTAAQDKQVYADLVNVDADAKFVTLVHGTCRRCHASDLTVMNKQTRSADEGMTEMVVCNKCGHTRRRAA